MAINLVSLVMQFLTPDMIGRITERPARLCRVLPPWALAGADASAPQSVAAICRSQIASGRDDGTQTELERQQWLEM